MATNRSIVQGAYNVAKSRLAVSKAKLNNKLTVINSLVGGFNKFYGAVEKEGQKYDNAAKQVIDSAGVLGEEEIGAIYDQLDEGRNDFIWGDKKQKTLSIKGLNNLASQYKHAQEVKLDIAKNYNANNFYDGWDLNGGQAYKEIMSGDKTPIMKDGNLGYDIEGEWIPLNTVQSKMDEFLKPDDFIKDFTTVKEKWNKISAKVQPGQDEAFPLNNVTSDMETVISDYSYPKLKSIALTKMPGFKKSFMEKTYDDLMDPSTTYESLGITTEMVAESGVNVQDGINEDEATLLLAELISQENELLLKEELTDYFQKDIENSWNDTYRPSAKEGFRAKSRSFIPIDEPIVEEIDINSLTEEEKNEMLRNLLPKIAELQQ